jgi:hypothetical protein
MEEGKTTIIICSLVDKGDAGGSGVEVVCCMVAALLIIADGVLGDLVVREEVRRQKGDREYEPLSREWMEEQVRIGNSTIPRIVNIFQWLLDGFQILSNIGWEK